MLFIVWNMKTSSHLDRLVKIQHNDANGEGGNDGCNDNFSWNCGIEGKDEVLIPLIYFFLLFPAFLGIN